MSCTSIKTIIGPLMSKRYLLYIQCYPLYLENAVDDVADSKDLKSNQSEYVSVHTPLSSVCSIFSYFEILSFFKWFDQAGKCTQCNIAGKDQLQSTCLVHQERKFRPFDQVFLSYVTLPLAISSSIVRILSGFYHIQPSISSQRLSPFTLRVDHWWQADTF